MPSLDSRPPSGHPPHAEDEVALRDAAARLDAALGEAQVRDPALLSSVLRGDPVRDDLRAILARLDSERVLPLLHRLAAPDLPERRKVFDGLLADVQDELLAPLSRKERELLIRLLTRILEHHTSG